MLRGVMIRDGMNNEPLVIPKNLHKFDELSTQRQIENAAKNPASVNYSLQRRVSMTDYQKQLCRALGESRSLWYAMRRHGPPEKVEEWLRTMVDCSDYKEIKDTPDEVLRHEYLRLFREVTRYDSRWRDEEMEQRREARRAQSSQAAS